MIEIDEETFNRLPEAELGSNVIEDVLEAVENGTVLPKGHGTLKDVDNIKTAFPNGELVRTESVKATIDHEETIIKADEGE